MKTLTRLLIVTSFAATSTLTAGCKMKNPMPTGDAAAQPNPPVLVPQPQPQQNNKPGKPIKPVVTMAITADKSTLRRGDTATFTLTARNPTDQTQRVTFTSGQRFDVVVTPENSDDPTWRWSMDKMFTQDVRDITWQPGETKTFTATWELTAEGTPRPGRYIVRGELASQSRVISAPLTITIN